MGKMCVGAWYAWSVWSSKSVYQLLIVQAALVILLLTALFKHYDSFADWK